MKLRYMLSLAVAIIMSANVCLASSVSGKVTGAAAGTVVWVDDPSAKVEPPSKPVVIDQKGLVFIPHIIVVTVGATVDFLNSDSVAHNVFWPNISGNKKLTHNLGTWPKGEKRSFKFNDPGVVTVLCNVHPEMSAYIIVAPSSHYAITDASGEFTIQDVPDGAHNITAWHEGMKQQSKPLTVTGATKADFTMTK